MERSLYDCQEIPVGPEGTLCRVVMATHSSGKKKSPVGVTRAGIVYELFFTNLPQHTFTARDVVELYLHRGAFEPALSDEDREQDQDRWCSHAAWGQECWQMVSQWVQNPRLELGHQLSPTPLRITEFAPTIPEQNAQAATPPTTSASASGYRPDTGHDAKRSGSWESRHQPGARNSLLRWFQAIHAAKMRGQADRAGEIGTHLKGGHPSSQCRCRPPLEPPGVRSTFQGLLVRPKMGLLV
jgi:hypothetical protein